MILTLSPRSNVYLGLGFSIDSFTWFEDLVRLLLGEGDRAVAGADEARHLGRVLDEVPGPVRDLLPSGPSSSRSPRGCSRGRSGSPSGPSGGLHLHDLLGRDLDAADLLLEVVGFRRCLRLSETFFSKPEYVWTMYHCFEVVPVVIRTAS